MGVAPHILHSLLGLWKGGHFKKGGKVIEFGSQEMHLPFDAFETAVQGYGVPGYNPDDFQPWEWETRGRCVYASAFYKLLGFSEYACLDLNKENNAIPHDMNFPLEDRSLWNKYDLVTDFGCAEHVFNVGEAFRTMHRLCAPGGIILSDQLMFMSNGYYLFEPGFYEDLCCANSYEIVFCALTVQTHCEAKDQGKNSWLLPLSYELIQTLDWTKVFSVGVLYAMRKTSDQDFLLPYQGKYISTKYKNLGYECAALTNYTYPSRTYVPVLDYTQNISSRKFKSICKAYFKQKLAKWLKK